MLAPLFGLLVVAAPGPAHPDADPLVQSRIASWVRATESQRISVWTDHDENPYRRGERARVYFHTEVDGFVTVLRVDTDGRVRVLFPREPWEDNFARGGRTFEVLDRDERAFSVDDYPGVGYIFAVSSPDPFQFDEYVRGDHWDYRLIAEGRVRGDPYVTLTEFASRIAGPGEYDYDITSYYVEQHYEYPRFLCYDCHSYVSYSYWNPYHYNCNRFRIVIYDDYYYYPYRYYRGRNVVFVRPIRPGPRYVFKDQDGRREYVTRERERPVDRRVTERDRTSADVGGRGSIPSPGDPRRRVVDTQGGQQPSTGRDEPRRRTNDGVRTDQPSTPDRPQPRRQDNGDRRPNITPAVPDRPGTDGGRREPERKPDLREVDERKPNIVAPDRDGTPGRRAEPSRSEPDRTDPRRSEPERAEPSRSEPRRSEPPRSEPSRAEPSRSEPRRAEPTRSEPRRAEPSSTSRPRPTGQPELRRRKPS